MFSMRYLVCTSALLLALMMVAPSDAEKVGTKATCHNYVCQTEYGFYKHVAEWNSKSESCECVAYFTEGVCKDAKCADGYMTVEKDGECACSWPCDGLHCQGPFVAMPDYERKDPDNLCQCQLPPKNKCHDEL
mmetsp:Transcript_23640/g.45027  ORF Transcript_23640/g.45027 Transcript_23640/m.45027 type:complete len:133 (+) Transcript_23640:149-547(+)